jgi:hypothetical protein
MSKSRKVFTWLCVAAVTVAAIATITGYRQTSRDGELKLPGIPFEVLSTESTQSLSTNIRTLRLFLPIQYYSRENLDRLFRFYSRKYRERKGDKLDIYVYTNKENFKRDKERPSDLRTVFPNPEAHRTVLFDASFYRDPANDHVGRVNEWYRYRPNLNDPDETKIVVIKGRAPSVGLEVVETWETTNNHIKIRVTAYKQKSVEPAGTYYTFESVKKEFLLDAREIMTFRHENQVLIPRDQIHFVNDQFAYVFMGWMYAVTTDRGYTWSVWDAERDLPNWQCCNYDFIKEIQMGADGAGTMRLSLNSQEISPVQELYTQDYGRHWTAK